MCPAENQAEIVTSLSVVPDPLDRLNTLVSRAAKAPAPDESERLDEFLVHGCQAALWVVPKHAPGDGLWTFRTFSPSPVVAALGHLVAGVYSGCAAADIAAFETTVLHDLGLDQHLTPNRRQGAANIGSKIRSYVTSVGAGP